MPIQITYLAVLYIMQELINIKCLHLDPTDKNRVLIYRTAGKYQPEGWYSQNIHEAASETFQNKQSLKEFLECAKNAGVNIDKKIQDADRLLHG